MTSFLLSKEADEGLQDIFVYSSGLWGEEQAEAYVNYLFHAFELL